MCSVQEAYHKHIDNYAQYLIADFEFLKLSFDLLAWALSFDLWAFSFGFGLWSLGFEFWAWSYVLYALSFEIDATYYF